MDIVLSRTGGVPVRDQLRFQLELKILVGDLTPGQRLPSVRALARRLKVHPNTVSAAYQDMEATGLVELRRGAGVFLRTGLPQQASDARDLDELVRLGLYEAFRRGFSTDQVRAAVQRWMAATPADRLVVIDTYRAMAEVLAHELREALQVRAGARSLAELVADPEAVHGALLVTLPYHVEAVRRCCSGVVEPVTLEQSEECREAVAQLPEGAALVLVSHSTSVLPFAEVLLKTVRGDAISVQTRVDSEPESWRLLIPGADLVLADIVAAASVRRERPRRLMEMRLLAPASIERVRLALALPAR